MTNLPAEIFTKIFDHLQKSGTRQDIKNVGQAVSGTHLETTFEHLTIRSGSTKCQPGNFVCPICIFGDSPEFDSIFEDLCLEIFRDHWTMYGASLTVKGLFEPCPGTVDEQKPCPEPPSKRRLYSVDGRNRKIFTKPDHVHQLQFESLKDWKSCQCNVCENSDYIKMMKSFANDFLGIIEKSGSNPRVLDEISSELNAERIRIHQTIPLFTDMKTFIDHLNESHGNQFSLSLNSNNFDQKSCSQLIPCTICSLNYDSLFRSKCQGVPADEMIKPSEYLRKLKSSSRLCIPILKGIKQPAPFASFDTQNQNESFLSDLAWPILGLAVSVQIENHIMNPTKHFEHIDPENRRALALRDLLHCFCFVTECLEFDFEVKPWVKGKFATIHGLLEILNSFFPKY